MGEGQCEQWVSCLSQSTRLFTTGWAQESKQKDFPAVSPSAHPDDLYSPFLTAAAISKVCFGRPSRQGAELRPGLRSSVLSTEVVIAAAGAPAAVSIDLSVPCSAF